MTILRLMFQMEDAVVASASEATRPEKDPEGHLLEAMTIKPALQERCSSSTPCRPIDHSSRRPTRPSENRRKPDSFR